MKQALVFHGGAFESLHQQLVGVRIDFSSLDAADHAPALWKRAQHTWLERVVTEYRSAQMMSMLLGDTLAAGDPFDVHAGVVDAVRDELRHVALCAELARAMDATPCLPEPTQVVQSPQFLAMAPAQRALSVGITLLLVNETLSVGFIRDLHARCKQPAVHAVLDATLADEAEHEGFGFEYVRRALEGASASERAAWRKVAAEALRPQRERALAVLREVPPAQQSLDAFPDEAEVALGLFSNQRQALVLQRTYAAQLEPWLRELELL